MLAVIIFLYLLLNPIQIIHAADGASFAFSPATKTIRPGETFTLDIVMTPNGEPVLAAAPMITFDAKQLTATIVTKSPSFPHMISEQEITPGAVSFTVSSPSISQPVDTQTTIASVAFMATSSAQGTSTIRFGSDSFVGVFARGKQNALTATAPATITIEPTDVYGPTITIISPTDNSTLPKRGPVLIKTTASDPNSISKIAISIDGVTIFSCMNKTGCEYRWDISHLPLGTHNILVAAWDNAATKNKSTKTISVIKRCSFRVFNRCLL